MNKLLQGIVFTVGILAAGSVLSAQTDPVRNPTVEAANRKLVLDFYDLFFNHHKTQEAAKVVAENYRQHNPDVPDGKAPFVDYFTGYFKDNPQSHARIIRSAVDGDLVWLQVHSVNNDKDRGQAVLDIFRVSKGKIVEHWDIIQNVPEKAANSNTMF